MANCITCGRPLPAFTFGTRSDVCATCRASAIDGPAIAGQTTSGPTNNGPTAYAPGVGYPEQNQPAGRIVVAGRRGPVTTVIVGINIAVFAAMALSAGSLGEPTIQQLISWGANIGPLSLGTEPWRMLTSNYVHIGLIHILFNMWCLWDLGNLAERIFDPVTYVVTYTICGIAGSISSLWWHPLVVGAGASGAIFGLAGLLIAALYLGQLPIPKQAVQRTLRSLMIFAGYNLFFGAVGAGIDNSAHLGGFVSGLIIGAVLARHLMETEEARNRWRNGVLIASAVVLLVVFNWVKKANGHLTPTEQGFNLRTPNSALGRAKPQNYNPLQWIGSGRV
jgi:rhomboid protease GluP